MSSQRASVHTFAETFSASTGNFPAATSSRRIDVPGMVK